MTHTSFVIEYSRAVQKNVDVFETDKCVVHVSVDVPLMKIDVSQVLTWGRDLWTLYHHQNKKVSWIFLFDGLLVKSSHIIASS